MAYYGKLWQGLSRGSIAKQNLPLTPPLRKGGALRE